MGEISQINMQKAIPEQDGNNNNKTRVMNVEVERRFWDKVEISYAGTSCMRYLWCIPEFSHETTQGSPSEGAFKN